MDWFQCFVCTMWRVVTWIRVEASGLEPLQCTSNHDMPIFLMSSIWRKSTAKRNREREISFMVYGFQTCLWSVYKRMECGASCVHINVQDWQNAMANNLRNYMSHMKHRVGFHVASVLGIFGLPLSNHTLNVAIRICCSKIRAMPRVINTTWVPFNVVAFVRRLSSSRIQSLQPGQFVSPQICGFRSRA